MNVDFIFLRLHVGGGGGGGGGAAAASGEEEKRPESDTPTRR